MGKSLEYFNSKKIYCGYCNGKGLLTGISLSMGKEIRVLLIFFKSQGRSKFKKRVAITFGMIFKIKPIGPL